jgi:hypothetical protein
MKTKVSQKEWNDKRDQFLCALYANPWRKDVGQNLLKIAEKTTSELYEVEEIKEPRPMTEEEQKANEHLKAVLKRDHFPPNFESVWKDSLQSNPQPTDNPNEQFTPCSFPPKGEELVCIAGEPNTLDTRPFNPKVVEIFNEFLPKEIAPLAIEAHKRSVQESSEWDSCYPDVSDTLWSAINWASTKDLGNFHLLQIHTEDNTITATPEQLKEWFPQAYKGGENE